MSNAFLSGENQAEGSRLRETRWLTPKSLIAPLGTFDLDPCGAPGHELAKRTYLLENGEDGLRDEWEGRVWLNPPYGNQARPFLQKLVDYGFGTALIFARTETRLFRDLAWGASALLFLHGRVTFLRVDGTAATANAGAPSVLLAYGKYDASMLASSGIPGQLITSSRRI